MPQPRSSLHLQSWEHGGNSTSASVNWDFGTLVIPNYHGYFPSSIFCTLAKSQWSHRLIPAANSCRWTPPPGEGMRVPCVFPFCLCCRPECTTSAANMGKTNLFPKEIWAVSLPGPRGTCRAVPCTGHVPVGCVGGQRTRRKPWLGV